MRTVKIEITATIGDEKVSVDTVTTGDCNNLERKGILLIVMNDFGASRVAVESENREAAESK